MKQTTITGIAKPVFDTIIGEYIISDAIKNNMSAVSGKNNKVKKRLISVGIIKECKIIHYFVRLGVTPLIQSLNGMRNRWGIFLNIIQTQRRWFAKNAE